MIFLRSNFITTIPANIVELQVLEVLALSENPITYLPVLTGLSNLVDFYCTQTFLEYINETTFMNLNNLVVIELTDSPFTSPNMTELIISPSIGGLYLEDTFLSDMKISCSTGPGNCGLHKLTTVLPTILATHQI